MVSDLSPIDRQHLTAAMPSAKEGYTLDLDSTRLLHEDGHQQGVAVGYRTDPIRFRR